MFVTAVVGLSPTHHGPPRPPVPDTPPADVVATRPEPKPKPAAQPSVAVDVDYWNAVAMCESTMRWSLDSTFDGGLQFLPSTWVAFGGEEFAPFAYMATPFEQMVIAERTQAGSANDPWPHCP